MLLQSKKRGVQQVPHEELDKKPKMSMNSFPEIDGEQAYETAKLGVMALIFQLGFHTIESEALETLTRCALKKLNKMCHAMQILKRRLHEGRQCAQQVPILQTLEQYNLAPLTLHKFYHGRILDRRNILLKQCEALHKKRLAEKNSSQEKDESEENEEEEIPESEGNLHDPATQSSSKDVEKMSLQVAVKNISKPTPRLTKLIQPIPIPGLELEQLPPKSIQRVPRSGYLIQTVKATTPSSPQAQNMNIKSPTSPVKSTVPQKQTRRRSPGIVSDTKAPASKRGRRGGF
uniref:Uncharacterized protein n=1 Tax=Acrobeloides nanus TaxID=290746 RepID=A0A914E883_9BILA